jgi:aspartate-semialdehyde dehydrogenase
MNLRSADSSKNGHARVAVVGASTEYGTFVREALENARVPGGRVNLYGTSSGEALISEYHGEARLIQDPDLDEIATHDLIFLCERGEIAGRLLSSAGPGSLVIDLLDISPSDVPRVHLGINPQIAEATGFGRFAVPHPLTLLLAELLHPLDRGPGVVEASAVILRPAADFGREGVEELRQQTVGLLSFAEVPVETFGRQLAFNIIPQAGLADGDRELETRIVGGVQELLGWEKNRLTVKLMAAPVFYGHGIQLRFRLEGDCAPEEIRELLEGANPPATR